METRGGLRRRSCGGELPYRRTFPGFFCSFSFKSATLRTRNGSGCSDMRIEALKDGRRAPFGAGSHCASFAAAERVLEEPHARCYSCNKMSVCQEAAGREALEIQQRARLPLVGVEVKEEGLADFELDLVCLGQHIAEECDLLCQNLLLREMLRRVG